MSKQGDEHRERARQAREAQQASFDRSDTDGFLSQWALGISAQEHEEEARLADAGGMAWFPALFDEGQDREVACRWIETKFGPRWRLDDDEAAAYGRQWVPLDGSHWSDEEWGDPGFLPTRSRVQASLGLIQKWVQRPARVVVEGSGRGLSGQAWVVIRPVGAKGPGGHFREP